MRYALLIYRHEDTAVSDRERERRQQQFTAILDGLRARGVLSARRPGPGPANPASNRAQPAPAGDLSTLDHREARDEYAARFY